VSQTIPLTAPLDELLDAAQSRYDARFEPVSIGGDTLELLQVADLEALIDRQIQTAGTGPVELPYWAKIWPASMLLGHFLAHLDPGGGRSLIELGCGIGICGLFAAKRGFRTLLTDIHPDALLFSQINVLHNGLADRASVARADFTADRLGRRFDVILGAEVLYMEDAYRGLLKFLLAHLSSDPAAEIVLAKDYTRKATRFLGMADREFTIAERVVGYKETSPESGEPERRLSQIYRLSLRKRAQPAR
jgi:predicted nicotinamide N-methyase